MNIKETELLFNPSDSERKAASEILAHSEPVTVVPANFEIDDEGVFFLEKTKSSDGDNSETVRRMRLSSRIDVRAYVRDIEQKSWARLVDFCDPDGERHHVVLPMELFRGGGDEYRTLLLSQGLEIQPGRKNFDRLTQYLQGCKPKKRVRCIPETGWHGESFVLTDRVIGKDADSIIYLAPREAQRMIRTSGTVDDWIEQVGTLCRGNSRLIFAISNAFAAPLLALANCETSGVNLKGNSSSGKSTAIYVAASVFGPPEYVVSWRATTNGLEGQAMAHNDLPLMLDELGQVDPRDAGEAVYTLCNGIRKARATQSGSARATAHWRTRILSSGEIGLSEHLLGTGKRTMAGQEVRLVDVPADAGAGHGLFESLPEGMSAKAFSDHLRAAARESYGSVGIAFIDRLAAQFAEAKGGLREKCDHFINELVEFDASGQVKRVAHQFAIAAIAGELATIFGLTGWDSGESKDAAKRCLNDWLADRGTTGHLEDEKIIAQVRAFIELHGESRFTPLNSFNQPKDDGKSTMNRAGFRRSPIESDETEYVVFRETFQDEICKGINWRRAAKLLGDKGILKRDSQNRNQCAERLPGMGKVRCYVITAKLFEDLSD